MNRIEITGELKKVLRTPLLLFLLLAAMNIGVYMISFQAGLLVSLTLIIYLIAALAAYFSRKQGILREMITFASGYGQIQKELLTELSIPYAVTDEKGHLLWFNEAFEKLTGRDHSSYHKSVTSLFSSITQDRFPSEGETEEYDVTYGKRDFRLQIRNIVLDELVDSSAILEREENVISMFALFLFEETELNEYIRKYEDETMATGLIYIDNYDEALEGVEDVRRSLLTALIDRKISKYFADVDGLVKKYEKDK